MRRAAVALLVLLTACGEEAPVKRTRGGSPPPSKVDATGGQGLAAPAKKPEPLVVKAKVAQEYRRELRKESFVPDTTGELNRDPFTSYLVARAPVSGPTQAGTQKPQRDECDRHMVADKATFTDLRLVGVVMQGTRNFAMFKDAQGLGHVAHQGDCLSKDKARIREITASCVRLEIHEEAPIGAAAPAPAPREQLVCLHPDEIEVTGQ